MSETEQLKRQVLHLQEGVKYLFDIIENLDPEVAKAVLFHLEFQTIKATIND